MKYYLAFIMFVFCLGFVAIGTAHHGFSHSFPDEENYGPDYLDLYEPGYYYGPYWTYPYYPYVPYSYVPAKMALQATKERLWANQTARGHPALKDGVCFGPRARFFGIQKSSSLSCPEAFGLRN